MALRAELDDEWNADWPKVRSWDLWTPDQREPSGRRLVANLEELLGALGMRSPATDESARTALNEFMRLPASRAMPERLAAEVAAFLARAPQ